MDFDTAYRSVYALLAEARTDAEVLLEESSYLQWQQAIERRANRDWTGELEARLRQLLAYCCDGTEQGAARAADDLRQSFSKLVGFVPTAVRTGLNNDVDTYERDTGDVRFSPTSWPRLDAIRATVQGSFDKLIRLMQLRGVLEREAAKIAASAPEEVMRVGPGRRPKPPMPAEVLAFIREREAAGFTQRVIGEEVEEQFRDSVPGLKGLGWNAIFAWRRRSELPADDGTN